jgi:hypothetical protein
MKYIHYQSSFLFEASVQHKKCRFVYAVTRADGAHRSVEDFLAKLLRSHRPTHRTIWRQPHRCHQIDGKQGVFSGHIRNRQNPADLAKRVADISMSILTQDEPS